MAEASKQEIKLFYCYAREDRVLRDQFETSLSGLKRYYRLSNWYDREILAGQEWEQAIAEQLNSADIIFLLISSDFMASDYCYGIEMQRALERHREGSCLVIPILLRPTHWEGEPFGKLQLLPSNARPITRWPDRDDAFEDVAIHISKAIKSLSTGQPSIPKIINLPKTKEKWVEKGKIYRDSKRFQDALEAYEQAILLDPTYVDAYDGKGWALYRLEKYEEGLDIFDQAILLDGTYVDAYSGKGWTLYRLKRYEEALTNFEQAILLDPTYVDAYDGKGWTLYRLRQYEQALSVFDHLIQIDPSYKSAYEGMGSILKKLGRMGEAMQAFDKVHQLG